MIDPHRLYALSEEDRAAYERAQAERFAARDRAIQAQVDAAKDPFLAEKLRAIRVLYRQPDLLTLWGIPYEMREGQTPRDLWNGRRVEDTLKRARGWGGFFRREPGPLSDWIWLGRPGWWGAYPAGGEERRAIESFLARLPPGAVPRGPCEWTSIADLEDAKGQDS